MTKEAYVVHSRRKIYAIVAAAILIVSTIGVTAYIISRPSNVSLSISNVSFNLGEEKRTIELEIEASGTAELDQIVVNNTIVQNWTASNLLLTADKETQCILEYYWIMDKTYAIKVTSSAGQTAELVAKTPTTYPILNLNINNVDVTSSSGFLKVSVDYDTNGKGIDNLHVMLFAYYEFRNSSRNIYIFYDPERMADESIKRAEAIVQYFDRYGVPIYKIDFSGLEELAGSVGDPARRCVLIVVDPLKDSMGRKLYDSMPSPLLDPNGNGTLWDDSKYKKSFLFDWMSDEGAIIVTIGSLQPHKRILYGDGIYTFARDATTVFDTHLFFTNATGNETILKGGFTLGNYTPVRVSDTLGLSYRDSSFGFDKNSIERYGLQYYAYGDYNLPYDESYMNLTLPVFIRVGEGGWLAMGDKEFWLTNETFAHDLFSIYMQDIWDSKWIPYGWYWDSGSAFHNCSGILSTTGTLETELIPSNIVNEKLVIRVVGIAYSSDPGKGITVEHVFENQIG